MQHTIMQAVEVTLGQWLDTIGIEVAYLPNLNPDMCSPCGSVSSSTKLNFFLLSYTRVPRAGQEEMLEGNTSTGNGSAAVILRFNL